MAKRKKRYPNFKYVITDEDILSILNAINNDDYDYVIDFFEDLPPVNREDLQNTYSFEQILANAGIVVKGNR